MLVDADKQHGRETSSIIILTNGSDDHENPGNLCALVYLI